MDFNVRMLGSGLPSKEFTDATTESRNGIKIIGVTNPDTPSERSLNQIDYNNFNQAYTPKYLNSNSEPLAKITETGVHVAILFNDAPNYLKLNVRKVFTISGATTRSYCQIFKYGARYYHEVIGSDIKIGYSTNVTYNSVTYPLAINFINSLGSNSIYLDSIETDASGLTYTIYANPNIPQGVAIPCRRSNGQLTENSFNISSDVDYKDLSVSTPSFLLTDPSTHSVYSPSRNVIYGALNRTQICKVDITNLTSNPTSYSLENGGQSYNISNWDGDLQMEFSGINLTSLARIQLYTSNSGTGVISVDAVPGIFKSYRKITIINNSNKEILLAKAQSVIPNKYNVITIPPGSKFEAVSNSTTYGEGSLTEICLPFKWHTLTDLEVTDTTTLMSLDFKAYALPVVRYNSGGSTSTLVKLTGLAFGLITFTAQQGVDIYIGYIGWGPSGTMYDYNYVSLLAWCSEMGSGPRKTGNQLTKIANNNNEGRPTLNNIDWLSGQFTDEDRKYFQMPIFSRYNGGPGSNIGTNQTIRLY